MSEKLGPKPRKPGKHLHEERNGWIWMGDRHGWEDPDEIEVLPPMDEPPSLDHA